MTDTHSTLGGKDFISQLVRLLVRFIFTYITKVKEEELQLKKGIFFFEPNKYVLGGWKSCFLGRLENLFYWKQGPEGLPGVIRKFKYCLGYKAASSSNLSAVENLGEQGEKETLRGTLGKLQARR